jgi:hypothetical protein
MTNVCRTCGRSESLTIADAKAIGLQQEFERGIYTCCQIAAWAEEQSIAWFEATHEWCIPADEVSASVELNQTEAELVPVRTRRPPQIPPPQVPWFRNPDDRR